VSERSIQAERRAAQGEHHIARQLKIAGDLDGDGYDSSLTGRSSLFSGSAAQQIADLDRLSRWWPRGLLLAVDCSPVGRMAAIS
jgi:hypothetical protein